MCVCVRASAAEGIRVRACVIFVCGCGCSGAGVCLSACCLAYSACHAQAPYCERLLAPPNFSTYLIKTLVQGHILTSFNAMTF